MRALILGILLSISLNAFSQQVIFEGTPVKKIETTEMTSSTMLLTEAQGKEYKVKIVKEGENYYWASRGNLQVVPMVSGSYITFMAVNGAGYVRTYTSEALQILVPALKAMPAEEQAKNFFYLEHLVHQMGSITYYGR